MTPQARTARRSGSHDGIALTERLHRRVLHGATHEGLLSAGMRVAVALSGGSDSVALTLLLKELAPHVGFTLRGVAHLNHHLRPAAEADESFCRALARRLGIEIVVAATDVRGVALRERISIEEAGHRARYRFFAEASKTLMVDCMATAHTRDDQAETFLMRMLRGAGPAGLAGIRPRAGQVIRPLLEVSRAELRTFLAARGQTYRDDETNRDLTVTRNRIRHELLPFLQRRFSPSVAEALARGAQIARHDSDWLEAAARAAASNMVTKAGAVVKIDRHKLSEQPRALGRRIVKRALEEVSGTTAEFNRVERLLRGSEGSRETQVMDMPGCAVRCHSARITIGPPRPRRPASSSAFEYALPIPGSIGVQEVGLMVTAQRASESTEDNRLTRAGSTACVDVGSLDDELVVRSWRPGDRVRPIGLGGRKKLQDLFVDGKVPVSERSRVLIVAHRNGGIIWVVGHAVGEDFRVTPASEGMLILKVRSLGGPG